ncbi:MAG: polyprenyl synthetase family protein [Anaerolineales bacterium]|nr:polyprenyl synthetase family protein [Anaerolineales bacterium]
MLPALEQEMRAALHADGDTPDLFYGMMHYHMGWVDANLQPASINGGKRIRPLLCLLTCQAAGGQWQQALPAAAAIEILHNFSLVHDDIEDASPTRRGRATVWQLWGIEQAINSGDTMFAISHLALNRLADRGVDPAIVVTALRRFDETCVQLTYGQHLDMDFERRDRVTVDEYVTMITGKTAVLIALSAELGARIAGAPPDVVEHYAQFGLHLGLAFQVIDDILGIWGDEDRTGKSAATDILTKKKTLPVLDGLAKSAELCQLYAAAPADEAFVQAVIRILDDVGTHAFAVERARSHSASALEHLQAAAPAGQAGHALQQLADMLLTRDF